MIRTGERDNLIASLKASGIDTLIHYPVSVHLQEAYKNLGFSAGDLPNTEQVAKEILSLPIHPEITREGVKSIYGKIIDHLKTRGIS